MIINSRNAVTVPAMLVALSLTTSYAQAQTTPDSGETLRNIQRQPSPVPERRAAPLSVEETAEDDGQPGPDMQIPVEQIRIEGNRAFDTQTLHTLVADAEGQSYTLDELNDMAGRITDFYRDNDYMVARAYIPAQRVENGIIIMKVMEGEVGQTVMNNKSLITDTHVANYVDRQVTQGDTLRAGPVDRSLLLLSDTPGVGGSRATLRPGESVGTSELVVNIDPAQRVNGNLAIDNYGNRYTGRYRLDGALALNSPLGIGDQLTMRYLTSEDELDYGRIGYSFPIGYDGLRLGAAYATSWYELGEEFNPIDAHGRAENTSVYATYPVVRTLKTNLYSSLSLEDKRFKDRTENPPTESDRSIQLINAGLAGNHEDDLLGGGITSFELGVAAGNLRLDSVSSDIDDTTARSEGNFKWMTYNASRLQRLSENNLLYAGISGQQASKNLNSSEKISLGGATGVRAYPQGEADGDEGWLGTVELRHNFPTTSYLPFIQGTIFYDIGSVKINKSDFNDADNRRTISGAGVGLNAKLYGDIDLVSSVAWRTSGGEPQSDSRDNVPRFWLRLSKQF